MYTLRSALSNALCVNENSTVITELFNRFHSSQELLNASEHDLKQIKGIGSSRAKQIVAAVELAKWMNTPTEKRYVHSPKDIFDMLRFEIGFRSKEHFVVIYLDTKNGMIDWETIAIGTLDSCLAHCREIFRGAIVRNSCSIILAHNHPSGDPTPSHQDLKLTTKVVEAGEVIQIQVLDHIVICQHSFYSLREKGHM